MQVSNAKNSDGGTFSLLLSCNLLKNISKYTIAAFGKFFHPTVFIDNFFPVCYAKPVHLVIITKFNFYYYYQ